MDRIEEIRRRAERCTLSSIELDTEGPELAGEDIPYLLARVEELERENAELHEVARLSHEYRNEVEKLREREEQLVRMVDFLQTRT